MNEREAKQERKSHLTDAEFSIKEAQRLLRLGKAATDPHDRLFLAHAALDEWRWALKELGKAGELGGPDDSVGASRAR